jgi:hypothetical protein
MYRYLPCLIFLVATTILAQTPIPRQGNSCPTGTYKSGDYCKASGGSDKQVITREPGAKCPTGWYKSDGYCTKY